MTMSPANRGEPGEARFGPEVPPPTRIVSLCLWSGLTLLAVLLTPSTASVADPLLSPFIWSRGGGMGMPSAGSSPILEFLGLSLPVLAALSALCLLAAWYSLYRFLKIYLLPVLYFDARPHERGPDVRTQIATRSLQRAFFMLAVAAVLRSVPGLVVQMLPIMARTLGTFAP
jgi:hypothetical protein